MLDVASADTAPRIAPWLDDTNRSFWTGGARGLLLIQWCAACSRWVHPPVGACPACEAPLEPRAVSNRKIRQHLTQGYLLGSLSRAVRFCRGLVFNHQSSSATQHVAFYLPGSYQQMEPAHLQIIKDGRDCPSANIANLVQKRPFGRLHLLLDDRRNLL